MEDGSKASHSVGGGGQQRRDHPRPFFYVQPPSQPYYLPYQQWQMNNPYAHFAMPGGFNMARPCLHPYQYMQYPGFVFPHAPLYPMDFRRVFEPRFPGPHWDSSGGRSHPPPHPHPPPPPQEHRETTSAGAQTDPSDAITKLIERLDKMQTGDAQRSTQRPDPELDSGVASSQSSAMFSPTEEKKSEQHQIVQNTARSESSLETPASTFSTIAVYDGDSSHRSLDCWSGAAAAEEELPLDSSSVQEDQAEPPEEQVVPIEMNQNLNDFQTNTATADQNVPSSDEEQRPDEQKISKANLEEKTTANLQEDASFQILKLPFGLASEAKAVSPLSQSPYYYNYLSLQSTHERMSVLSPSLDELSSRDEMFSTDLDLEEMELFPRRVYPGGRRLCGGGEEVDEIWTLGSKRFVCACCGKSLPRGASTRSKVHCSKVYLDEGGDSDEDARYVRGCEQPIRVVVRKHSGPRKTQPLPQRLTKSWYKRGANRDQTSEQPDPAEPERRDTQEEERGEKELHNTCQERLCREEPDSEQSRWTEGAVRRRTAAPTQRQELPQRKVLYHRPRDEEDETPPLHWDRGAVTREPPC